MLSRGVNRVIERNRDPLVPFSGLADDLLSTDFNFGNLESPVSGNDNRIGRGLVFNTKRKHIEGLSKYNFKVVSLANNHALDQSIAGLRFTRTYLSTQGIEHIGAGEDQYEAWEPKIVTANGIRIGFIGASYSSINDGGATTNRFVARIEDHAYMREAVGRMKSQADVIVVAMHAGVEYTRRPHRSQVAFARAAIDAGADVVIGSHPHWIQTIEQYRGKFIFYSLGNFIFDQPWQDTREGLAVRFSVSRRGQGDPANDHVSIDEIRLVPIVIEHIGMPRPATPKEAESIFRKIGVTNPVL
jgi:poly-gamma-glutamate synthesis protein (capsule biosynthesis protein)